MTSHELLPWTEAAFDTFFSSQERRAHAYMLAGHSGLGKTVFAQQLAKSLLCQEEDIHACGQCQSCRLFESGSHPDLHVLQSEKRMVEIEDLFAIYAPRYLEDENKRKKRKKPSAIIAIDQVRGVIPDINTRPHLSTCRLILINTAEDLNINAANSLLKSLEEPPSDSYFILISHDPGRILPTLRSRCNRIDFRLPDKQQAMHWLSTQLADQVDVSQLLDRASGIPLRALEIANGTRHSDEEQVTQHMLQLAHRQIDPASAAAVMIKTGELKSILESIQLWLSRLIRLKVSSQNTTLPKNEADKPLIDLGNRLNFRQLYAFLDKVSNSKQLAGVPLDPLLALEDDLISWQAMFSNES
ncbi:MAG: DNA polymerase III subunit delta' [Gammaproteobacteria bacterium]|nr:MAG: DNA polymerase III subunit delta' [Gammaproteobacteria bacterium]